MGSRDPRCCEKESEVRSDKDSEGEKTYLRMPTDPEGRMMTIECSHSLALRFPDSSTQGRFRSSSNQLTTSAESVEFDMILPRVHVPPYAWTE